MKKAYRRTPRDYDGPGVTTRQMKELLPHVLAKVDETFRDRPDMVLLAWPQIIGEKMAKMTQAVSFHDGNLVVKVKNSTLHSILSQNDKPRILSALRQRFPQVEIRSVQFRIG